MNKKFDLKKLNNLTDKKSFEQGVDLKKDCSSGIYDNSIEFHPKAQNFFEIYFQTYTLGSGSSEYDQKIHLIFRNSKFINAKGVCNCPVGDKICKHQISAILTFLDEISIEELALLHKMDIEFDEENINQILKHINVSEVVTTKNDPKYSIIPHFFLNKSKMSLSLKISKINGKSYTIKNLEQLNYDFNTQTTESYNKDLEVTHDINEFVNKEMVISILRYLNNKFEFIHELDYENSIDIKYQTKSVMIDDEFFNTLFDSLGNSFTFKINAKYEEYMIHNEFKKIKFNVSESKDKVFLEANQKFTSYVASKYLYIINTKEKLVTKVDCNNEQNSKMIYQMLQDKIVIEDKNVYKFKYSVLNRLSDFIELSKPLEFNDDKYNLISSKTRLELEGEKLFVSHYFVSKGDYKSEVLPTEQINNLMYISSMYSDSYNKEENVFEISGVVNILKYVNKALPEISKYSDEITSNEEFDNFEIKSDFTIDYNMSSSGSSVLLDFKSSSFSDEELLKILRSLKSGQKYYQLKDKSYVYLEDEQINSIKNIANKLNVDLESLDETMFKLSSYNALYLEVLLNDMKLKFYKEQKLALMLEQFQDFKNQKLEISKDVKANLRDYQQEGVNWLNTLRKYNLNGILADDMGLGKTLQVIAFLSSIEVKKPILIIAPASLIYNWEGEIIKFNPNLKYKLLIGTPSEREEELKNIGNDILITSYNLLKKDIDLYKDIAYEYVILDEGQNIKNKTSQATKAIKLLKSNYNLVLTGTPIENNLFELWSIFDFLMPNYLGKHLEFKKDYVNGITKNNDKEALLNLQKKVRPFILRRLKVDVLKELPKKQEKVLYMDMSDSQRKVYDAQVLEVKNMLNSTTSGEFNKKKIEILAMLTKLRQITCNPSLIFDKYKGESIKGEMLVQNLLDLKASEHKVLVFSQFVSNFDNLEVLLKENDISFYRIDGSTPKSKRHMLIDDFNADKTDVFLISLKAGGTGLNIIGADTVIHYDPWWNTAVEMQATDRAYRMGQTKNVLVYKYICKNTIEEKILEMQESKKDLATNILEGESSSLSNMKKEDFLKLFD